MSDSKFSANQIDVVGLSNDPTMQGNFVSLDGDTMTGDLGITGATARLNVQPDSAGVLSGIYMQDSLGVQRVRLLNNETASVFNINVNDAGGSPSTSFQVRPGGIARLNDGINQYVAPVDDRDVAVKKYVDDNIVFTEDTAGNIVGGTGAGASIIVGAVNNFLAGVNAGGNIDNDDNNIVIGTDALADSSVSLNNVAIGVSASEGADITSSVVIGYRALQGLPADNLTSASCVLIGDRAGQYSHGADNNVIIGRQAGNATTTDRLTGGQLTFIGNAVGFNTSTAIDNTAIGYQAMLGTGTAPQTGNSNVAVGSKALFAIEGAANTNVAVGRDTLDVLTTGNQNTALGYNAGATITTGAGNVLLGYLAGPTTNQSNKLYIDNSQTDTPLIGGDFSANTVTINGTTEFTAYSEKAISYGTTGAIALDTSTGTYFYPTGATTGVITFSFTNPAATGRVTSFTLETQGGGDNAPVWPSSVVWPGGTEPTWSAAGSPIVPDIVSFVTRDNGTTWFGMLGGLAFA